MKPHRAGFYQVKYTGISVSILSCSTFGMPPGSEFFQGEGKCFNTEIPEKNKRSIDRGIYYIILYSGKVNIYVFVRANDNNIIWKEMILLFSIAVKGAI